MIDLNILKKKKRENESIVISKFLKNEIFQVYYLSEIYTSFKKILNFQITYSVFFSGIWNKHDT